MASPSTLSIFHSPLGLSQDAPHKKPPSVIWRGFKVVGHFFYQTPAEIAVILLLGALFLFVFPPLAPPLFAIASSVFVTRLAVKVTDHYNNRALDKIKEAVCNFNRKYPKIRILTFLGSLAACAITPIAGAVIGVALGALSGIIIEVDLGNRLQQVNRKKQQDEKPNTRTNIIHS